MSLTWRDGSDLAPAPLDARDYARVVLRGGPLLILIALGLGVTLLLRLVERPLVGSRRPLTPWITVLVCRGALRLLGLRVRIEGRPSRRARAVVANHSSWLDIFVLNAQRPIVFVAKAEVASWPGIGWLARATGTLFVRREARGEAGEQVRAVAEKLSTGPALLFFPEGTSTDGRQVLPFKPALFAGLLTPGAPESLSVQPATVTYEAPAGEDPRFYAWFGDMAFGPHLLGVLAARRGGNVRIAWHPPILVAGRDRKSLAAEAEAAVRSAL